MPGKGQGRPEQGPEDEKGVGLLKGQWRGQCGWHVGSKDGAGFGGRGQAWQARVRGLQGMRRVGVLYDDPVGCAGKGLDNQGDRPGAR